jgi:hypothetical protein
VKHTEFLKSLKTLKSHLLHSSKKYSFSNDTLAETKQRTYCSCIDASGQSKYLYTSQKEIEYILSSKPESLRSYPCPHEKGWHLTKG